eukprot:scaffold175753_cov63-Attheya_sp.AAC.6
MHINVLLAIWKRERECGSLVLSGSFALPSRFRSAGNKITKMASFRRDAPLLFFPSSLASSSFPASSSSLPLLSKYR